MFLFRGTGKGKFAASKEMVGLDGKALLLDFATSVSLFDWNKDGKPDLVVGTISGPVWYVPNLGGGKLGQPLKLSSPVGEMDSPDGGPSMADWDGDGVVDLFLGEDTGQLLYFRGKKGGDRPQFESPLVVLPDLTLAENDPVRALPGTPRDWNLKRPKMRPKPTVCDWNGDGKLDLLVGDYCLLEGEPKPLSPERQKEFENLRAEQDALKVLVTKYIDEITKKALSELGLTLSKKLSEEESIKYSELFDRLLASDARAVEANRKLSEIFDKILPMMPEVEFHGFVWLYLHK